jgi:XTP/dITP diphosphohydrolase
VEALGGAPGLYSARYHSKPGATDADRRGFLLKNLCNRPRPWKACFRCCIALANPGGNLEFTEGICDGVIIPEERGTNGFGYDPIFLIEKINKTMAELTLAEKNRISHRARATQAVIPLIISLKK